MEFRVLGPVDVLDAGRRVELGGQKQRTVMALLLANAGQPVTTDRLIEAAYGDDGHDGARRSVQTYVSTLRSQFGDMITSVPSGYEFRPVDSFVDAERFVAQMEGGRSVLEENPAAAAEELTASLALWRGRPYSNVDAPGELDAEISRLNGLRLVALESRIDADLAVGADRELVGELEALTTEHPLREAFHSQQMLALYRSGRQADALRVYARMRERLVDELGVDPSPALRHLEQRILEQDPGLLLAPETAVRLRAVLVVDLAASALESIDSPDERRRVLAEVDRAIGRSIPAGDGDVAAQQGTATYGTFDEVRAAIDVAVEITATAPRIDGSPVVRVGLDLGDVEDEPGGGLTGAPVVRAAGLVAAAHPGQVLLSAEAQAAAVVDRSGGSVLKALGEHSLARMEQSESVHQLVIDGMPSDYPELLEGSEPPELPGARVGAPGYELRDEIGHGLFGSVYRAYQPSVGREVAVKVINPELANSAGFIRRFAVEAQMISRIEHPNVVPLYDFWRGPEAALLVMRLMRGGNLAAWASANEVDHDAASRLIDQIGGALATAHSLGIAHGDVQAGNVLLNESGDFFLGDFGIASDSPTIGGGLAQQADVAAFATMVDGIVNSDVFNDSESTLLVAARAGDYTRAGDWLEAWRRGAGVAATSPTYTPTRNPYKGLAAFGELDVPDFHGRESATSELVEAVVSHRLVAVVGPSGVGKSSVVRAGLLPALRGGATAGSDQWLIANCVPGSHPFEQLATSLMLVAATVPRDLEELLRADQRGLIKAVERYLPVDSQLLLVIDQFEELFTLTRDEGTSQRFLDLLQASVEDPSTPVRIVVTIRADFFDRPLRHPAFGELLRAGTMPISAPTDAEMREIITRPAGGLGVEFESGLVERMISEVRGEAGALPLAEFALTELFGQRDSDLLSLEAYESSGGVTAALGRRAEDTFIGLDAGDRDVARQLFMRMVTPGEDGRDTRHRLRRSELIRLGLDAKRVDSVLARFGDHRLLTFDRDEVTRGSTVEVAHEALLREWPRLKEWIDDHRQELVLRSRLAIAVGDWEDSGRAESYLLGGGRLTQHESWVEHADMPLSSAERGLLAQSRLSEDERLATRSRQRRYTMSGFAAAAVVGVVLAVVALNASRQASENEQQALAAVEDADAARSEAQQSTEDALASAALADRLRGVAEGRALIAAMPQAAIADPQHALILAIEASERLGDVPIATTALHDAIAGESTVAEIRFDSDVTMVPHAGAVIGDTLAGFNLDGDLSPDGSHLAVVGPFGDTVEVYRVDTGELTWAHSFGARPANEHRLMARFIGDGRELLVGVSWHPGAARAQATPFGALGFHVLDSATGEPIRRYASGPCGPVAKSTSSWGAVSDHSRVAAVTMTVSSEWHARFGCAAADPIAADLDGAWAYPSIDVEHIDMVSGDRTTIIGAWDAGAIDIALAADGKTAAYWAPGQPLSIVEVESGDVRALTGNDTGFSNLSLDADGSSVAASGAIEGEFVLYDLATGAVQSRVFHPTMARAWFAAGGSLLFVADTEGELRTYDSSTGEQTGRIDFRRPLWLVRATPDATRVAAFALSRTDPVRIAALDPSRGLAESFRYEPCRERDPSSRHRLDGGIQANGELISFVASCEASDSLAEGSDGHVYSYSIDSGERQADVATTGPQFAIGDGVVVVSHNSGRAGEQGGTFLSLVDVRTGIAIETLASVCAEVAWAPDDDVQCSRDKRAIVTTLEISPDATVVAAAGTASEGAFITAWNRVTNATLALDRPAAAIAISPDGSRLAIAEPFDPALQAKGVMRLYDTSSFDLLGETSVSSEPVAGNRLAFSGDGTRILAVANGLDDEWTVRVHDAETLMVIDRRGGLHDPTFDRSIGAPGEKEITSIDASSDGAVVSTTGVDGFVRIWDIDNFELVHVIAVREPIVAGAFLADDAKFAVGTSDGVRIYWVDAENLLAEARLRVRGQPGSQFCDEYFPDGDCPIIHDE